MAKEPLGNVLYDLIAEVAKNRTALCEADQHEVVESAYAAACALDKALKASTIPSSPETLRKLRSAKGKIKRELQEWDVEAEEPDVDVETATPPKGAAGKKKLAVD